MSIFNIFNSKPAPDVILDTNTIVFSTGKEDIIKLTPKGFYFKGELVEDKGKAYDAFNSWLEKANAW